ncbi:phospholipid phosphatase 1 [Nematostella vectensis]|uniref:phospholipid phosphatase 1 n=1 Tax=Nematostella vectensis TaxID=45351 RepID=UPI0020776105|nr:phospholipid phosphatase 1 [Nematostella vectensis]
MTCSEPQQGTNSRDVLTEVVVHQPASSRSENSKNDQEKISLLWPVIDTLIIAVLSITILALLFKGQPYHRGFYCNDETINKPYKDSTVKNYVATLVGLLLPVASFILVETLRFSEETPKERDKHQIYYVGSVKLHPVFLRFAKIVVVFLFGAAVNTLLTDVGKYSVGRLRPHFLTVCKPDTSLFNCTTEFITSVVCTGDPAIIRQARLSFPSGHSSFAAYTMCFLVLYIQARVDIPQSYLLKPLLQLIPLILGILCGLSRISDYKHHWSDVFAGLALGTTIAYGVVWFHIKWFKDIERMTQKGCKKSVKNCV